MSDSKNKQTRLKEDIHIEAEHDDKPDFEAKPYEAIRPKMGGAGRLTVVFLLLFGFAIWLVYKSIG